MVSFQAYSAKYRCEHSPLIVNDLIQVSAKNVIMLLDVIRKRTLVVSQEQSLVTYCTVCLFITLHTYLHIKNLKYSRIMNLRLEIVLEADCVW